jgi:alpha-L-fucosidase
VAIAKAAGMKYMVFTSRHHDGFSEFDTQARLLKRPS